MEKQDKKKMCSDHLYRYVSVWMEDGTVHDGIVESVDEENVYLAVPMTCDTYQQAPAHGMHAYCGCMPSPCGDYRGFFPYGGGYGYGRRRRFNRLILPLFALTAISLLPYY
ncbi:hypothetical protein PUW24_01070 [Paenibacillus urinalis]|uniref:Phosphatidylinositol kinase n=1 Tax=Paenibacillus urinalis TaxID=521520 RepID=A0AAX3MW64_9BACL|nr:MULTISPECIES: hypothetical protein [Paenibacillus]WDH81582.1 hypothetical protein PUW23_18960 [Paenibacillus urinalis]WDH97626.1 hypothetical protein PUW24_01070 [Paenibacillus urinalis]WDI01299.1 hypothetical protein PUW25_18805 [Paenibacillus urinalis]GAK39632.1 hypothetical protein TCA2_2121 [Paenibacillus sp. TCA20]